MYVVVNAAEACGTGGGAWRVEAGGRGKRKRRVGYTIFQFFIDKQCDCDWLAAGAARPPMHVMSQVSQVHCARRRRWLCISPSPSTRGTLRYKHQGL